MQLEDLALTMTPGLGDRGCVHLLDRFGRAEAIFAASEAELVARGELASRIAREIVRKTGFAAAEREAKYCACHDIKAVASTDPEYPALLRDLVDYPHVLYVQGAVEALQAPMVTMVGTRRSTTYGQSVAERLIGGLAEKLPDTVIVSGLALGIDAACHRAALACGLRTVAVIPEVLPRVTPAQHAPLARDIVAHGGALVSELPSTTKRNGAYYIPRNRILAGISAGTVVVESALEGGSLVTAELAASCHRAVMAPPGRITDRSSAGTNLLIRNQQAQLILSSDDIIRELMWDLERADELRAARPEEPMTPCDHPLAALFPDSDPLSFEALQAAAALPAGELKQQLLEMELQGLIRCLPGNRYLLNR